MSTQHPVRFEDGAAYEPYMGVWSREVGARFLRWLAPPRGLAWADVGCGNGAFTELLCTTAAARLVEALDPSEGQLSFARGRPGVGVARFRRGDAMALPMADASMDAAAMALVIFFVPDPARGVAEMARVVRPGGLVGAYAWDVEGGGFPHEAIWAAKRALGLPTAGPPRPEASRLEVMQALWAGAGLVAVETTTIRVEQAFASFDAYWDIVSAGSATLRAGAAMSAEQAAELRDRVRARLGAALGRFTIAARAHAVKGRVRD